jgi:hypothetical protein
MSTLYGLFLSHNLVQTKAMKRMPSCNVDMLLCISYCCGQIYQLVFDNFLLHLVYISFSSLVFAKDL